MSLPTFKDDNKNLMLVQSSWASQLNPILSNPITNPVFVKNYSLVAGVNVINHKLGMTPVGWFVVDTNSSAIVYRSQPFNPLTLTLTSTAPAVVTLAVF